jgi:hypothetical protein
MQDEQIAGLAAQEHGKEQPISIQSGEVRINGKPHTFEQTELFDGKLLVYLPSDFADMSAEIAKIKYPSSDRPSIIKSDERGAATFTFGTVDGPIDEDDLPELAAEMKTLLQRLNPSYLFFETEKNEAGETRVADRLEYKSPAIDGTLYNVMYFVPAEGRTVMGTFTCPYDEHEEWRPVVSEIIETLRVIGKEKEENA